MRRATLTLCCLLALLVSVASASASWTATGAGTGAAHTAAMPTGSTPTVAVTGANVTVTWAQNAFVGATLGARGGGYTIARYAEGGATSIAPLGSCAGITTGTTASLSCTEVNVPYGRWEYRVTPVIDSFVGTAGARGGVAVVLPPAPVLSSVTAQNPSPTGTNGPVAISWTAVAGVAGYDVFRRVTSGSYDDAAPLNGATPVTATTFLDTTATGGVTSFYVVRAVTATQKSARSNELSVAAFLRPPPPATVTATLAPAAKVTVSWPTVAGASGYVVYRRLSTGTYDYAVPLSGPSEVTATSYTDTTSVDATSYRYTVRAVTPGAAGVRLESFAGPDSAVATADGTTPTAVTVADPGSPLRGGVALTGAASDAGSGVATVRFQTAPAGTSTWTDGCVDATAPYGCTLTTTALADGLYDLRAIATDVAGNTATSTVVTARRVDNTAPTVTMGDPGAFLRLTVTLTATAADAGSGLASIVVQRAPTGSTTWTPVCTMTTSPASCPLNTTALTAGGYDLRAIATDLAGNATTSALVVNRIVDNVAPVATDVQTTNKPGGTVGRAETGDTLTYTFSEPPRPASILAGWTGAATLVAVRISNANPDVLTVFDNTNITQLALGSVALGKKYVTGAVIFTGSSMVLSGSTITITLGTLVGVTSTANGTVTMQWTPSTAATDRAGNPMAAAAVAETGAADLDF